MSLHIKVCWFFFSFWQMKIRLLFGSHEKEGNEWVHQDDYPNLCTASIIHQLPNTFTEQPFTLLANTLNSFALMATQKTQNGNYKNRAERQRARQKCPEDLPCSGWILLPYSHRPLTCKLVKQGWLHIQRFK